MVQQDRIQLALRECFAEIKSRNQSYSLRAFASKLGLSSGALSEILNGRRRISQKLALRLIDSMTLSPEQKGELLNSKNKKSLTNLELQLTADQFHTISDWSHFALISLMKTKGFKSSIPWIAKRLGLPEHPIQTGLERLLRLGLIQKDHKGSYRRTQMALRTTDDIANASIRRSHFVDLELAKNSLEQDPIEVRDFTAITINVDMKRLAEAKKMIREFQDNLSDLLETKSAQEVYKMTIYLYPLTKNIPIQESSK